MIAEKFITSVSGLFDFALYFGSSVILVILFLAVYVRVTPYREFKLISEGNLAAAYSFSGALLGFAIPLASAVAHSVGLIDMIIWGTIALIVQIITFFVVKTIFPSIVLDIPANHASKGLFLGVVSLTVGILNAACITY
jgi:putative membrane protein